MLLVEEYVLELIDIEKMVSLSHIKINSRINEILKNEESVNLIATDNGVRIVSIN